MKDVEVVKSNNMQGLPRKNYMQMQFPFMGRVGCLFASKIGGGQDDEQKRGAQTDGKNKYNAAYKSVHLTKTIVREITIAHKALVTIIYAQ